MQEPGSGTQWRAVVPGSTVYSTYTFSCKVWTIDPGWGPYASVIEVNKQDKITHSTLSMKGVHSHDRTWDENFVRGSWKKGILKFF